MAGYQHKGPNRNECHHHVAGPDIPSVKPSYSELLELARYISMEYQWDLERQYNFVGLLKRYYGLGAGNEPPAQERVGESQGSPLK